MSDINLLNQQGEQQPLDPNNEANKAPLGTRLDAGVSSTSERVATNFLLNPVFEESMAELQADAESRSNDYNTLKQLQIERQSGLQKFGNATAGAIGTGIFRGLDAMSQIVPLPSGDMTDLTDWSWGIMDKDFSDENIVERYLRDSSEAMSLGTQIHSENPHNFWTGLQSMMTSVTEFAIPALLTRGIVKGGGAITGAAARGLGSRVGSIASRSRFAKTGAAIDNFLTAASKNPQTAKLLQSVPAGYIQNRVEGTVMGLQAYEEVLEDLRPAVENGELTEEEARSFANDAANSVRAKNQAMMMTDMFSMYGILKAKGATRNMLGKPGFMGKMKDHLLDPKIWNPLKKGAADNYFYQALVEGAEEIVQSNIQNQSKYDALKKAEEVAKGRVGENESVFIPDSDRYIQRLKDNLLSKDALFEGAIGFFSGPVQQAATSSSLGYKPIKDSIVYRKYTDQINALQQKLKPGGEAVTANEKLEIQKQIEDLKLLRAQETERGAYENQQEVIGQIKEEIKKSIKQVNSLEEITEDSQAVGMDHIAQMFEDGNFVNLAVTHFQAGTTEALERTLKEMAAGNFDQNSFPPGTEQRAQELLDKMLNLEKAWNQYSNYENKVEIFQNLANIDSLNEAEVRGKQMAEAKRNAIIEKLNQYAPANSYSFDSNGKLVITPKEDVEDTSEDLPSSEIPPSLFPTNDEIKAYYEALPETESLKRLNDVQAVLEIAKTEAAASVKELTSAKAQRELKKERKERERKAKEAAKRAKATNKVEAGKVSEALTEAERAQIVNARRAVTSPSTVIRVEDEEKPTAPPPSTSAGAPPVETPGEEEGTGEETPTGETGETGTGKALPNEVKGTGITLASLLGSTQSDVNEGIEDDPDRPFTKATDNRSYIVQGVTDDVESDPDNKFYILGDPNQTKEGDEVIFVVEDQDAGVLTDPIDGEKRSVYDLKLKRKEIAEHENKEFGTDITEEQAADDSEAIAIYKNGVRVGYVGSPLSVTPDRRTDDEIVLEEKEQLREMRAEILSRARNGEVVKGNITSIQPQFIQFAQAASGLRTSKEVYGDDVVLGIRTASGTIFEGGVSEIEQTGKAKKAELWFPKGKSEADLILGMPYAYIPVKVGADGTVHYYPAPLESKKLNIGQVNTSLYAIMSWIGGIDPTTDNDVRNEASKTLNRNINTPVIKPLLDILNRFAFVSKEKHPEFVEGRSNPRRYLFGNMADDNHKLEVYELTETGESRLLASFEQGTALTEAEVDFLSEVLSEQQVSFTSDNIQEVDGSSKMPSIITERDGSIRSASETTDYREFMLNNTEALIEAVPSVKKATGETVYQKSPKVRFSVNTSEGKPFKSKVNTKQPASDAILRRGIALGFTKAQLDSMTPAERDIISKSKSKDDANIKKLFAKYQSTETTEKTPTNPFPDKKVPLKEETFTITDEDGKKTVVTVKTMLDGSLKAESEQFDVDGNSIKKQLGVKLGDTNIIIRDGTTAEQAVKRAFVNESEGDVMEKTGERSGTEFMNKSMLARLSNEQKERFGIPVEQTEGTPDAETFTIEQVGDAMFNGTATDAMIKFFNENSDEINQYIEDNYDLLPLADNIDRSEDSGVGGQVPESVKKEFERKVIEGLSGALSAEAVEHIAKSMFRELVERQESKPGESISASTVFESVLYDIEKQSKEYVKNLEETLAKPKVKENATKVEELQKKIEVAEKVIRAINANKNKVFDLVNTRLQAYQGVKTRGQKEVQDENFEGAAAQRRYTNDFFYTLDSKTQVSKQLRKFLSNLNIIEHSDLYIGGELVRRTPKLTVTSFGSPVLADFDDVYDKLHSLEVGTDANLMNQLDKLMELYVNNPSVQKGYAWIPALIQQLGVLNVGLQFVEAGLEIGDVLPDLPFVEQFLREAYGNNYKTSIEALDKQTGKKFSKVADEKTLNQFAINMSKAKLEAPLIIYQAGFENGKVTFKAKLISHNNSDDANAIIENLEATFLEKFYTLNPTTEEYEIDEESAKRAIKYIKGLAANPPTKATTNSYKQLALEFQEILGIKLDPSTFEYLANVGISVGDQVYKLGNKRNNLFNTDGTPFKVMTTFLEESMKSDEPYSVDKNLFTDNAMKKLSRIEAQSRTTVSSNAFTVGDKTLYTYMEHNYATKQLNDFLSDEFYRDQLSKTLYTEGGLWLHMSSAAGGNLITVNDPNNPGIKLMTVNFNPIKEERESGINSKDLDKQNLDDNRLTKILLYTANAAKVTRKTLSKKDADGNTIYSLATIRKGVTIPLTYSDKHTVLAAETLMPVFTLNQNGAISEDSINLMYEHVLKPELERIEYTYNKDVNDLAYNSGSSLIHNFPSLNEVKVRDKSGNLDTIPNHVINGKLDEIKSQVYLALHNALETIVAEEMEALADSGINTEKIGEDGVVQDDATFIPDEYKRLVKEANGKDFKDENLRKAIAADYVLNSMVSAANMTALFLKDPALYTKVVKDANGNINIAATLEATRENVQKRASLVIGPGTSTAEQTGQDSFIQLFAQDIGYNQHVQEKELVKYLSKLPKQFRNSYLNAEIADGTTFVTLREFLTVKRNSGVISSQEFNEILAAASGPIENIPQWMMKILFGAEKPLITADKFLQVNDPNEDSRYVEARIGIKTAEFPLLPGLTFGMELDQLRVAMERVEKRSAKGKAEPKSVRLSLKSAVKVGFPKSAKSSTLVYDENDIAIQKKEYYDKLGTEATAKLSPEARKEIEEKFDAKLGRMKTADELETMFMGTLTDRDLRSEQATAEDQSNRAPMTVLKRKYYKIQQATPNKSDSDKTTGGSQENKIIPSEVIRAFGEEEGAKILAQWDSVHNQLFNARLKMIESQILDSSGNIIPSALAKYLDARATEGGTDDNTRYGLRTDENGEFIIPLDLSPGSPKYQSLINSIAVRDIATRKKKGQSAIMMTEFGFKVLAGEDSLEKSGIRFTSGFDFEYGQLKPARIENGEVKPAQVFISNRILIGGKKVSLDQYIIDGPNGSKLLDTTKVPKEVLEGFSFRIPTQGYNSTAFVEIVGFLPENFGDVIIAPASFVAQMGADFDIDKLFNYFFNLKQSADGTLSIDMDKPEGDVNDLSLDDLEKLENVLLNESLALRLKILQNENIFNSMQKPLDFGLLKYDTDPENLAMDYPGVPGFNETVNREGSGGLKEYFKKRAQRSELSFSNPLTPSYQLRKYQEARGAGEAIGVFARTITFQSIIQATKSNKTNPLVRFGRFNSSGVDSIFTKTNGSRTKIDVATAFLSAALDNEKEQILNYLNVNGKTFDIITGLIHAGFEEDLILAFIESPVLKLISSYEKSRTNNSVLNANRVKDKLMLPILKKRGYFNKNLSSEDKAEIEAQIEQEALDYFSGLSSETREDTFGRMMRMADGVELDYNFETDSVVFENTDGTTISDPEIENARMYAIGTLLTAADISEITKDILEVQKLLNTDSSGLGANAHDFYDTLTTFFKAGGITRKRSNAFFGTTIGETEVVRMPNRAKDSAEKIQKYEARIQDLVDEGYVRISVIPGTTEEVYLKPASTAASLFATTASITTKIYEEHMPFLVNFVIPNTEIGNFAIKRFDRFKTPGSTKSKIVHNAAKSILYSSIEDWASSTFLSSLGITEDGTPPTLREIREYLSFDEENNISEIVKSALLDSRLEKNLFLKSLNTAYRTGYRAKVRFPNHNPDGTLAQDKTAAFAELFIMEDQSPLYAGGPSPAQLGALLTVYSMITGGNQRALEYVRLIPNEYLVGTGFYKAVKARTEDILGSIYELEESQREVEAGPKAGVTSEITKSNYTRAGVKADPNTAYVFTENNYSITAFPDRQGGGSAVIRPEANAFAIVTKKKYDYNTRENVDYSDTEADFKEFTEVNTRLINELKNSGKSKIVFPQGFASDKAKLPTRFAEWLQKALLDNFNLVTELNASKTGLISKSVQQSSGKVTGPNVKTLSGVAAVRKAEKEGKGINTLRQPGNEHLGNPFTGTKKAGAIQVKDIETAVDAYDQWLRTGSATVTNEEGELVEYKNIKPEQREYILGKINEGAFDNATFLYFKEGYRSHADVLNDFVKETRGIKTPEKGTVNYERKEAAPEAIARLRKSLEAQLIQHNPFAQFRKRSGDKVTPIEGKDNLFTYTGKGLTRTRAGKPGIKFGNVITAVPAIYDYDYKNKIITLYNVVDVIDNKFIVEKVDVAGDNEFLEYSADHLLDGNNSPFVESIINKNKKNYVKPTKAEKTPPTQEEEETTPDPEEGTTRTIKGEAVPGIKISRELNLDKEGGENNPVDVLRTIALTSRVPQFRQLASAFLSRPEILDNLEFTSTFLGNDKPSGGSYNASSGKDGKPRITVSYSNNRNATEYAILHEMGHALTKESVVAYEQGKSFDSIAVRNAMRELGKIQKLYAEYLNSLSSSKEAFQAFKDKYAEYRRRKTLSEEQKKNLPDLNLSPNEISKYYGGLKLSEFVTMVLSDTILQQELDSIVPRLEGASEFAPDDHKSLFRRIIDAIKNILEGLTGVKLSDYAVEQAMVVATGGTMGSVDVEALERESIKPVSSPGVTGEIAELAASIKELASSYAGAGTGAVSTGSDQPGTPERFKYGFVNMITASGTGGIGLQALKALNGVYTVGGIGTKDLKGLSSEATKYGIQDLNSVELTQQEADFITSKIQNEPSWQTDGSGIKIAEYLNINRSNIVILYVPEDSVTEFTYKDGSKGQGIDATKHGEVERARKLARTLKKTVLINPTPETVDKTLFALKNKYPNGMTIHVAGARTLKYKDGKPVGFHRGKKDDYVAAGAKNKELREAIYAGLTTKTGKEVAKTETERREIAVVKKNTAKAEKKASLYAGQTKPVAKPTSPAAPSGSQKSSKGKTSKLTGEDLQKLGGFTTSPSFKDIDDRLSEMSTEAEKQQFLELRAADFMASTANTDTETTVQRAKNVKYIAQKLGVTIPADLLQKLDEVINSAEDDLLPMASNPREVELGMDITDFLSKLPKEEKAFYNELFNSGELTIKCRKT